MRKITENIRRVAALTTGRQDWGIMRSTCSALRADARFELQVYVSGMHWDYASGPAVDDPLAQRVDDLAEILRRNRPEALILVGDRSETLAAALAATLERVPIVHLHGGEETEGAIDNALRHALTKLAHLHLVSHDSHARRVRQMGEDPGTIHVVGAPGLDNLLRDDLPGRAPLEQRLGLALEDPVVIVTLHPATLGGEPAREAQALMDAMESTRATWIITQPNYDAGHEAIRERWWAFVHKRPRTVLVDALGDRDYWGLMRLAAALLGNSSSGVLEAPAAGLPAVNVGDRQRGRLRSEHVIDVPAETEAIVTGLRLALTPATRARLKVLPGPYPPPPAAPRIVEALAAWSPPCPPRKIFHDLEY